MQACGTPARPACAGVGGRGLLGRVRAASPANYGPPTENPTLEPLRSALQVYVGSDAALPKAGSAGRGTGAGKAAAAAGAEASVRTRQNVLANAIKRTVRPNAKQGDMLGDGAATAIRKEWTHALGGPKHDLLMDALAEQNDRERRCPSTIGRQRAGRQRPGFRRSCWIRCRRYRSRSSTASPAER